MMTMANPAHPGTVLAMAYLEPLSLSVTETAEALGVSRVTMSRLLNEKAGISAEMAYKLAAALDTTPEFWMNMQTAYDLAQSRKKMKRTKVVALRDREDTAAGEKVAVAHVGN